MAMLLSDVGTDEAVALLPSEFTAEAAAAGTAANIDADVFNLGFLRRDQVRIQRYSFPFTK